MKAKLASKSVVSVILALLMVISMITVGIVSATSAQVDVVESGAAEMEVYFTKPSNWNAVKLHYWGGSSSSSWPGVDMTKKYTNDMGEDVYYKTVPSNTTGIIFNNGSGTQSADLNVAGKAVVAYYWNGSAAVLWPEQPAASGSGTGGDTTPTAAPVTGEKTRLAIADQTDARWLGNDDARFKVVVNNAATDMTKSVDIASGLKVWYADVAKINAGTQITFQRCSAINSANVFNTFTTSYVANSPLYIASGEGGDTITASTMLDMPDGSATNFGYGIWVDTIGNGDTKDFVKIYANDFKNDSTYHLYLPGFVNTSALKVYTNFPSCTINGTAVSKGTAATLNLSMTGTEKTVSISYKRNASGSTHTGSLHVMKSGAAAMFMTTKNELYTGLAAAYAENSDGSANYAGVASYKNTVTTKGDYMFYSEGGKLLNAKDKTTGEVLTGLKKIKGRGNSSFEASMRLYGKYAYNITLNDKAGLIDGCEKSKKYCLLANNADESLMRNTTIFGIADNIGMPYTPNTRLVDVYDNGNYIGAYVITEKVEYGKSTLIPDAKSLDKTNEDILAVGKGIDYDGLKQRTASYTAKSGTTYSYKYSYNPSGAAYEFDNTTVQITDGDTTESYTLSEEYMKSHDFLLEHEITDRYDAEATWFISGRTKQAVVPKYPEFATQKEVQWMIEEYDALETAAFAKNYANVAAVADVDSFAGTYLIQELTMNLDACATSYYILGGGSYDKLLAAPLWDYDWAVGGYNGTRKTVSGQIDVSDYTKTYVKVKSVSTGNDGRNTGTYNLQAQLCQISNFWTDCKRVWTNKFVPALNEYLGDNHTLLGYQLPLFKPAVAMNESRWGVLEKNYTGAHSSDPGAATWGTRSTITYKKGSNNFGIGTYVTSGASKSYDNAVYYLNDWMVKRQNAMSNTMGLYDASLIEPDPTEAPTEAPTDPPTDAPTAAPTEAPTAAPTEAPTDAPTEAPTVAPTEAPTQAFDPLFNYYRGDTDGDGKITVMDATMIQRMLASYEDENPNYVKMGLRAQVTGNKLTIMDATAIQRYLAEYDDGHHIGEIDSF